MIDWTKILESHVIRTFRKICHKWWGIDIQFYDERCVCRNNGMSFQNPFCNSINSIPEGGKLCSQTYRERLKEFKKNQGPFTYECFAGLHGCAVPILVKQKYVGTMIGSGILPFENNGETKKKYKKTLTKLGFDIMELDRCCDALKPIGHHTKEYISDFMELVAEDVVSFYELLQEKEEIVRKRSFLLENAYKEKYKVIIGISPAIKKVFDTLDLIERSESSVLIEGESGTGKELVAAAVHYNSARKEKVFVIQNCSAFSDTLLNSELFGHEKGAFTGAVSEKKGLFEIADNGTLFLDEIGDMSIEIQARLLRVLEDGSFYRVGGTEQKKSNVRIIAATNKPVKELIKQGLFRKDLFYRINTIHLTIPPLRERKEDVPLLIAHFLDYYVSSCNGDKKEIHPDAKELLLSYPWPGNVRELKNLIERLVLLSGDSKTIEIKHIPGEIMADMPPGVHASGHKSPAKLADARKALERTIICEALARSKWNKSITSRSLGISRATLNNKIAELNIQPSLNPGEM